MNASPRYRTIGGGGASIPLHREKVKLRLWTNSLWMNDYGYSRIKNSTRRGCSPSGSRASL
ncbi:MAG: hypothetical protein ACE5Z5_10400 [Candidatus Bathyarchaeia archaeon]